MAKKKNKFKKTKKHHSSESPVIKSRPAPESAVVTKEETAEIIDAKEVSSDPYEINEYDYVTRDIKKILIIMASIIVLLIVFYFLDIKTTLFSGIGNWLYKILNIQTL